MHIAFISVLSQIQNPTVSDSTATVATPDQSLSVFDLVVSGGVIMIPIFLLWIIATYIFIERFLYLKSAAKTKGDFIRQINTMLRNSDIKAATVYAEKEDTALGKIISMGISFIGKPIKDIESMMESTASIEVGEMERNTNYLGIIAGIAPMLGFIGTIWGIIQIFYQISLSDNISIGIIASGLYVKMVTSGAGLIVGVYAYTAYHLLQQRIQHFTLQAQRDSLEFIRSIISPAR
jgi:biopolymer transport protein ExbB